MKPNLYVDDRSPPVRSVLMLIDELGGNNDNNEGVNLIQVDLFKREQFAPDYLAISPQHSVPALQHGDITLNDSHTILLFLVEHFKGQSSVDGPDAPDALWLPVVGSKPWLKVVDRLLFNAATLFRRDSDAFTEIFATQPTDISHHLVRLSKLFDVMETFLGTTKFIAGDFMTIADVSVVATVSTINMILCVDAAKWPRLHAWFNGMRERPSYKHHNEPGLRRLRLMVASVAKFDLTAD